ncbi:hypothetical protein RYH73_21405 [Olivibacter sp. CPCC 100613]|uniref:hypothetical protein n=1 Tax=Olivibacter sp. CPCC 100613 TaxID=3079931 RepID=UPI002FF79C89
MVDRVLRYHSFTVRVGYEPGIIRISNDIDLWHFFDHDITQKTAWLINAIQQDHESLYGAPLKIRSNSLAVEIWGHLYFEYYLLRFARFLGIHHQSQKLQCLLGRTAIIDCGEKNKDSNRFLWDCFALFSSILPYILPKNISLKDLKK